MPAQTKTCPACGLVVDSSQNICPRDGSILQEAPGQQNSSYKTCPSCGMQLKATTRVCPRDGTNLLYASGRPPGGDAPGNAPRPVNAPSSTLHEVKPLSPTGSLSPNAPLPGSPGRAETFPPSMPGNGGPSIASQGSLAAAVSQAPAIAAGRGMPSPMSASAATMKFNSSDAILNRGCPRCGFQSDDSATFCPLDGTKLMILGGGAAKSPDEPAKSDASQQAKAFTFSGMTQGPGVKSGQMSIKACPKCGFQVESTVELCPRDGTDLNPIVTDPLFVQKFKYLGKIGAGGMGVIYKAKHLILDKIVAIKMIHGHMANAEALQRFLIEGRATSLLAHPNIVAVHDLGTSSTGHPYMVMDYVQGKTLAEVFAKEPPLSVERFLSIFIEVCDALGHAHGKSILHRDLKPGNIMLDKDEAGVEHVKIMDFGIAKLLDDTESGAQRLTKTGDAIGSPIYMSPEQAQGTRLDGRSDLYSLGCVMFEALAGVPPFTGANPLETLMMHMQEQPPTIERASLGKQIDPRLETIVMKLLEKDPDRRYASMDDLKQDLVNYHDLIPHANKPKHDISHAQKQTSTVPRAAITAGVAVVILGLLAAAIFTFVVNPKRTIKGAEQTNPIASPSTTTTTTTTTTAATAKSGETKVPGTQNQSDGKTENPDGKGGETGDDVARLVQQEALRGDQKIDLAEVSRVKIIRDSDMEPLKEGAEELRMLGIGNSEITDKGLENLKKLNLTALNIHNCKVRDLHALANMRKLEGLNASDNKLSDAGFNVIAGLTNLKELKLNNTPLDDSSLRKLTALKNLRELQLSPCPKVTATGVGEFKKLLPKCQVSYSPTSDVYQINGELALRKAAMAEKRNDWTEAEAQYKKCMETQQQRFFDKRLLDFDIVAKATAGAANCEEQMGNFVQAIADCKETLRHLNRREVPASAMAIIVSEKANAEEKAGQAELSIQSRLEADKYFDEALPTSKDPSLRRIAAENKFREAIYYSKAERPAAGEDAINKAKSLCKALPDTPDTCIPAYEMVAGAFAAQGRGDKSLALFQEAEKYYKAHPQFNPNTNRLDLKRALGDTYYSLKRYSEAIPYLKDVVEASVMPLDVRQSRCRTLVDALNKTHNSAEAAKYAKKFR